MKSTVLHKILMQIKKQMIIQILKIKNFKKTVRQIATALMNLKKIVIIIIKI